MKAKLKSSEQRAIIRDTQTIQEIVLGIQDGTVYDSELNRLAEEIYTLASHMEELAEKS